MADKKNKKDNKNVLKSFELHASIGMYKAGDVIQLVCDRLTGRPKERYWRKRLRDAETDNCMAEVKKPKVNKNTKSEGVGE